ncbi:unnamed protein product [Symbiodinium sp. CCMP2456]|nr:unnamed protein product [Symbiodinium sp. CCMP2456]
MLCVVVRSAACRRSVSTLSTPATPWPRWKEPFGDRRPAGRRFCKLDDLRMTEDGPLKASCQAAAASKAAVHSPSREQLLCFDAAISSCSRCSQWQHALKLFEDMREDGLAPDAGIWDKLLDAMVISGEMAAAVALYRENAMLGLTAEPKGLFLRGKTVELAKLAVRVALLEVALSPSAQKDAKSRRDVALGLRSDGSLSLIVGLGRQSKGEALLGPALWQMLSQELAVQSYVDPENEGCLLIPSHELKSFARGVARVSQESKRCIRKLYVLQPLACVFLRGVHSGNFIADCLHYTAVANSSRCISFAWPALDFERGARALKAEERPFALCESEAMLSRGLLRSACRRDPRNVHPQTHSASPAGRG